MNSTEARKFRQALNRFERLLKLQGHTAAQGSYCRAIRWFVFWYRKRPNEGITKADFSPAKP